MNVDQKIIDFISVSEIPSFIIDEKQEILYSNDKFNELFEFETNEILGEYLRKIQLKDEIYEYPPQNESIKLKTKNNFLICVKQSVTKINNLFVIQLQNETDYYYTKKKLNQTRERFSFLIAGALDGFWDWNIEKKTFYISREYKHMLGYEDSFQMKYLDFLEHIHPEDRLMVKTEINEHFENKKPLKAKFRHKTKNKDYKWILMRGQAILENNKPKRISGAISDIDDQVKIENEIKEKNKELERFIHIASHDLREPLRKITFFASKMKRGCKRECFPPEKNYIERIMNSSERMRELLTDLLEYSMIGKTKSKFTKFYLKDTIKNIEDDLFLKIKEEGATINLKKCQKIYGIETYIHILLQNIISNSIKFKKKGIKPIIDIECETINNNVHIYIKDNGIGIEKKYHTRIFECFQRLHGKSEYEGTGIGLAICKKIIEIHKGKININSELNKGTMFEVILPLKRNS